MSNEDQSNVNSDQSQGNANNTTPPEPTLEDVYRSAGIDSGNENPTNVQPTQPTQSQPTETRIDSIPDPFLDTEGFRARIAQQQQGMLQTAQAVQQMAQYLSSVQQKEAQAALKKDIDSAVSSVNEVVNHPKPKVVEAMLHAKAMEDPKFQALWNNRHKNPTAWNSALKVVAKEFQKELDVKADPGLIEAQRARRVAQGQMATTPPDRGDNTWDGLSQADFDARWQAMTGG